MSTLQFYQKLAGKKRVTTREAAQLTGLSVPAASMSLRRLAAAGLGTQLKRGHWLIGSASGQPGALVSAAASPYAAYLSGWSALRHHGLIQQIPQTHFAMTLGRPGAAVMPGGNVALHRLKPELFGGYSYEPRVEGFVASPEKAIFDLAYLSAMSRSRVSTDLPETDLGKIRWKEVQNWLRRIPAGSIRTSVAAALDRVRERQATSAA